MTDRQLRLFSIVIGLFFVAVVIFACVQIKAYNAQRDAEDMDQIARRIARERESIKAASQGTTIDSKWRRP